MSIKIIKSNKIDDDLLDQVVSLVSKEGGSSFKRLHTFEYYDWKLRLNPNTSYLVANFSNEELTGVLTFVAKGKSKYSSKVVYELGDVYVNSRLKGRGIFFRMLRKFHKTYPDIEAYGTPNILALPSELKAGYIQENYNLCYRYTPIGIPVFHYLSNFAHFLHIFHVFDNLVARLLSAARYFFIKKIDLIENIDVSKINIKKFRSSVFIKTTSYLKWRYFDSPEPYKYLSSLSGEDIVIFKEIKYKNIPFVMIVDHNLDNPGIKSKFLMQLVKRTNTQGVFEMSSNTSTSIMSNYKSFCIKKIKFITYGHPSVHSFNANEFSFIAGDGDSI